LFAVEKAINNNRVPLIRSASGGSCRLTFPYSGPRISGRASLLPNATLLPYGIFLGSTAQWLSFNGPPVAAAFAEPLSARQYAVTRAFAVRSSSSSSQEKTKTSPTVVINPFITLPSYSCDEAEIRNNRAQTATNASSRSFETAQSFGSRGHTKSKMFAQKATL
jgi:hypothetical protein